MLLNDLGGVADGYPLFYVRGFVAVKTAKKVPFFSLINTGRAGRIGCSIKKCVADFVAIVA